MKSQDSSNLPYVSFVLAASQADLQKLQQGLKWPGTRPVWLGKQTEIQTRVLASSALLRIIPSVAQQDASAWVLTYRRDRPNEAVVVPIAMDLQPAITTGSLSLVVDRSMTSLSRLLSEDLRRAVYIRLESAVIDELDKLETLEGSRGAIQAALLEHSNQIAAYRREAIAEVLQNPSRATIEYTFTRFEENLGHLARELADRARRKWHVTPTHLPILERYADVLSRDTTTRDLLMTYATLDALLQTHPPESEHFDYSSMCSCLWKAAEHVLNRTIVWYARYHEKVVGGPDAPLDSLATLGTPVKITVITSKGKKNKCDLNRRVDPEDSGDDPSSVTTPLLIGLMLGEIESILLWSGNGIAEGVVTDYPGDAERSFVMGPADDDGTLLHTLQILRPLRNDGSHAGTLDLECAKEVRELVLDPIRKPEDSVLGRLLQLRIDIEEGWKKQHSDASGAHRQLAPTPATAASRVSQEPLQ